MPSKKLRALIRPLVFLFLFFAASVLLLNALIQRPSFQTYLLARLSRATGYELHAKDIAFNFRHGIGISAGDVKAWSGTAANRIVTSRAIITLETGELLRGRITPTSVFLVRPRIELSMETGQGSPLGLDSLNTLVSKRLFRLHLFSMEGATVSIRDLPFGLEDLSLDLFRKGEGSTRLNIMTRGKVVFGEERVPFTLDGTIARETGAKGGESFAEVSLDTGKVPLAWMPWPVFLPFTEGRAKVHIDFEGSSDGVASIGGRIIAEDLEFQLLDDERKTDYSFREIAVDFQSGYREKVINVHSLEVKAPDFSLKANSTLDFRDTSDPRLALKVESPFMPLTSFIRIFPGAILPEWISNSLFSLLTGGHVRLDRFSLNGRFGEIWDLDLPENAGALSLHVSWKDLDVLMEGSSLPFSNVSGELGIEEGVLSVRGVEAGFGGSTIKEGSLVIEDLYADRIKSDAAMEGSFQLRDLLRQKKTYLFPEFARKWLDGVGSVSGKLDARIKVRHEEGQAHPRIIDGEFSFKDCAITHKGLALPLSLGEADLKIDGQGKSSFWSKGMLGKSAFEANGTLDSSMEAGESLIIAKADMNEITTAFYEGYGLPVRFTDTVNCRLYLSRDKQAWSCRGLVDLEGVIMEATSFSMDPLGIDDRFVFSVEFKPEKAVHLKTFTCHLGESAFDLRGRYDLTGENAFFIRASTDQFRLEDLGIRFKQGGGPAKGMVECRAEVSGLHKRPSTLLVNGEIEGMGLSFVLSDLPSPVSDCDFKARFSGKRALLNHLKMRVGRSSVLVKGELKGWNGLKGKVSVKSDYLDLSDFISARPDLNVDKDGWAQGRFMKRSNVELSLYAPKGRWRRLKCGPIQAECIFREGYFRVERSRISMEQGMINLRGMVTPGKEPYKSFSAYAKVKGQQVKDLLPLFGLEKEPLEGRLTLEGIFLVKGRTRKELLSSLRGRANVLLEKGVVKKSRVIFKVLNFLSLQKIFEKRPEDISKEGFYFESIKGHFIINKGIISTDNLVMKSPVFNAASKGRVDLAGEWVDLDLGTQPFGTVDALISRIPVVGYILTGKEKSLLIYYFKVKGPLSGPDVKYVPLENLGAGTVDFFRRLFFTPGRLFKGMSRMVKDLSGEGVELPEEDY